MKIPARIVAGDTITWRDRAFRRRGAPADLFIGADAYNLSYSFRGSIQAAALDVPATVDGQDWDMTLTAAQTAPFNTGNVPLTWWWQAFATAASTGNRILAGQGELVVEPNLAGLSGDAAIYSGLTLSEQQLAMVRAELTARMTNHARTEYTIGNRHLKFEPIEALLAWQSRLELQVAREKTAEANANGLGNPSMMKIRFGGGRRPRGWGG